MRPALAAVVLMLYSFFLSWSHRDLFGEWHFSESLPWSTERNPSAGTLFELLLLSMYLFAGYWLVQVRRFRLEAPELPPLVLPHKGRVWRGAARVAGVGFTVLFAYWAGQHMNIGLSFKEIASSAFGIFPYELSNAAACFTTFLTLGAVVLEVYIIWGAPWRTVLTPVAPPQPAPPSPGPAVQRPVARPPSPAQLAPRKP